MLIRDLFTQRKRPLLSLEIFPPKKNTPIEPIYTTIEALTPLEPDFISVTYGAGGSNKDRTVEIATLIKQKYNIEPLAHLTCVSSTKNEIETILNTLENNKIKNILALRGDLPQEADQQFPATAHYKYASDLIKHIRGKNHFCISAACYPEGHITAPNLDQDIAYLKEKVATGTDFLITQLFFDTENFYYFMDKIKKAGITVPVTAGIMPLFSKKQIEHCLSLSKATLPTKFTRALEKYGDNPAVLEEIGIIYATEQISDLLSWGVEGIHIYTMNRPQVVGKIVKNIKNIFFSI